MDSKLIMVKSITLLYRESQLKQKSENSSDLVKTVLKTIKNPEIIMDTDFGREVISSLKTTALWMVNSPIDTVFDKTDLLQRIRVNVGEDQGLFDAVKSGIEPELTEKEIKKSCGRTKKELQAFLNHLNVKAVIKEAYGKVNFQEDTVDWRHFVPSLIEQLEPLAHDKTSEINPAIVDEVDLSDTASVGALIRRGQLELSTEGVMKFGKQAFNRMFGEARGIRRGEFVVVGALQHNYKSGQVLDMMKGIALYNKPHMRDPKKKPLLLRISLENSASDDILWLYKHLVEQETKIECHLNSVDISAAAAYVKEKMEATGYNIKFMRIDPSSFTFHDLFELLTKLETEGYEIHALFIDYLNMMSKLGCTQGPTGTDIRDLFRRVRNFTSRRAISCVTPHQLSTEAKMLLRLGAENFVQEIANKGYWDSCRTIDQEVDIEIYQHIVKVGDEAYLTMQRGKHRKPSITPEKDLYTIFKFERIGGILDDINGRDLSRKYVGGSAVADGGDKPWF